MSFWRIFLTVGATSLAGCGVFVSYPTFRYRLTVEVQTPLGLRTGSSVIQVACSSTTTDVPWINGAGCETKGQAVTVDLPGGKVLFALLTRPGEADGGASYAFSAFPSNHRPDDLAGMIAELKQQPGVAVLPRHVQAAVERHAENDPAGAYPMLVTFKNLNDPKSITAVDPDDLEAALGPNIRLKRITVQMTDDAITTGIGQKVRWLKSVHGSLGYDGQLHPQHPEKDITVGSFWQGTAQ